MADWAVTCPLAHKHVNKLLRFSKKLVPDLPLDSRTLLSTPRTVHTSELSPGRYNHFGVLHCIKAALSIINFLSLGKDHVELLIGIDGLPVSKSSGEEFWPILGQLKVKGILNPFMIGLYAGPSQPANFNDFLRPLGLEMIDLIKNGFDYQG